jgi:hypothetical protein
LTYNTQDPRPAQITQERDAEKLVQLEDENLQLKQAVHSHATVDQAIGVVLAVGELAPDDAWEILREVSQRTNVKLRHVAEVIVEWARTGELAAEIKGELERELRLARLRRQSAERTG